MLFRKTLFFVVTTVLICSSVMAHDSLDPPTVSLGIQHGHIKGFDDIKGGNFKVQYENSTPVGVMGSLTAMKNTWENENILCARTDKACREKYNDRHNADRKADYYSVMFGPTYQVSKRMDLFALAGVSHTKVDKPLAYDYNKGSHVKNSSESSDQVAYSAGITFKPIKNLALTVGYEGSQATFESNWHQINSGFVSVGSQF